MRFQNQQQLEYGLPQGRQEDLPGWSDAKAQLLPMQLTLQVPLQMAWQTIAGEMLWGEQQLQLWTAVPACNC